MVLYFRKICAYQLLVKICVSYVKGVYGWLSSIDLNKEQFKFNIARGRHD